MSVFFLILSMIILTLSTKLNSNAVLDFFKGFLFLKSAIIYLLSLELLKHSLNRQTTKLKVKFNQCNYNNIEIKLLSLVCAFPFGLGVSSFLRGVSSEPLKTSDISQGTTASMLIFPTTLASAFLIDYFNITSLISVLIYGLPISFVMIISLKSNSINNIIRSEILFTVVVLAIINACYMWTTSLIIESNFLFKQSLFFILLSIYFYPLSLKKIHRIIYDAREQITFFLCIGLLGSSSIPLIKDLDLSYLDYFSNSNLILFIPIVLIPILSIFFIHPLVLFIILSPIISPLLAEGGFTTIAIYCIWIVMLVNSQLLSPVSLNSILAAKNSQQNIFAASFLTHYSFCIKISIVSALYFVITK